jgi:uncharacterized protein YjbJ (UPF0337 family)
MKKRTTQRAEQRPEFRGVVKKMTGKLTNRPDLEDEGRAEMLGKKPTSRGNGNRTKLNPDPHRRG